MVYKNGKIGVNAEHSWADAPIVGHMWEVKNRDYKIEIIIFNIQKEKSLLRYEGPGFESLVGLVWVPSVSSACFHRHGRYGRIYNRIISGASRTSWLMIFSAWATRMKATVEET